MSATGQQQAISELISMSALIEQDLLDNNGKYKGTLECSKEHRLALMTTQSGRRRYHRTEIMIKMKEEPTAKTTSITMLSSNSSSSSQENVEQRPTSAKPIENV